MGVMSNFTAISYPVFLCRRQDLDGNWHAVWKSDSENLTPFHGREDMELFAWFLSGQALGVVQSWKKAIQKDHQISYPLHLDPIVVQTLKKPHKGHLIPDRSASVGYLGTIESQKLHILKTTKLYQALPRTLQRDARTWLAGLAKTPDTVWAPFDVRGPKTNLTAHQVIQNAKTAAALKPLSEESARIDVYIYPEHELYA